MKARTPKQVAKLRWYLEVRKLRAERRRLLQLSDLKLIRLAFSAAVLRAEFDAEMMRRAHIRSGHMPPPQPEILFEKGGIIATDAKGCRIPLKGLDA